MATMKLRMFASEGNSTGGGRVGFINNTSRSTMRGESRNETRSESRNEMRGETQNEGGRSEYRESWRDMREERMEEASRMNRTELESSYAEMCMKHGQLKERMKSMDPGYAEVVDKVAPLVGVIEEVFPKVMQKAEKVLANPPKTWDKYLEKGDIPAIIRMEGDEFMKVLEKADSVEDITKEATHTIAAVMMYCLSE